MADVRLRAHACALIMAACFGFFSLRLFVICCAEGRALAQAAIDQRSQSVLLEAGRGDVYDRYGLPLNAPEWVSAVAVFPSLSADSQLTESLVGRLGGRIPIDRKPILLQCDAEQLKNVQDETGFENMLAAAVIPTTWKIRYGARALARHVVGYLADMAENRGVAGVELTADEMLRSKAPRRLAVYMDGAGMRIPWLGFQTVEGSPENAGIYLTLDGRIQAALEIALQKTGRPSAGVVIDVATGDVLAMASTPIFDQNKLGEYLQRPDSPFLNRALRAYTPGSVFKLVTAACALEEGLTRPEESFHCTGKATIGHTSIGCSKPEGHGTITLEEAFAQSCNVTFIELGRRAGARRLIEYAQRLGLGRKTGVGLPEEQTGFLPPPTSLYLGDVANISIGQGAVTVTPLQMAVLTRTIAAGGLYREPRLLWKWVDQDGRAIEFTDARQDVRVLSEATANKLKDAMSLAVQPGRTGTAAYIPRLGCAGKTGSAETGKTNETGEKVLHSWFSGYAPAVDPKYAACIFVEEGGYGGVTAAPVFRELMSEILGK